MFAKRIPLSTICSVGRVPMPSRLQQLANRTVKTALAPRWASTLATNHANSLDNFPIPSSWSTIQDQPLTKQTLGDLFLNRIPSVAIPNFLTKIECQKLLEVAASHQIGAYSGMIPPVGRIGITQFEHQQDKETYFNQTETAASLQRRFLNESNIDIMGRVRDLIQQTTSLPVRIAREGDREYFAGLVRCINSTALIHADYGPFDGPDWEIGKISAQITWNILLKQVSGGETIVYDRPWQGDSDNKTFGKPSSYGYSPTVAEGRMFKVLPPKEGYLTLFNSRNFHEVKQLDKPKEEERFTISSFIGLLPESYPTGPAIILWS